MRSAVDSVHNILDPPCACSTVHSTLFMLLYKVTGGRLKDWKEYPLWVLCKYCTVTNQKSKSEHIVQDFRKIKGKRVEDRHY